MRIQPTEAADVLVTGVSGTVGDAIAERFTGAGHAVRVLVRTEDQAARAALAGWQPVFGDLQDPASLEQAVSGVHVVVHAAAYMAGDRDLAEAINVGGTIDLGNAALAAGVARFIHISTMSVHGEPQPDGLTEASALASADSPHPYVATKAQAEIALDLLRRDGLDVTILRPGAICRTHNSHWGDKLIDRLQQTGWPSTRHPLDVIPWVHTDDLAEMVYLCAANVAASGETYLAVDANVSLAEYWGPICHALSRPVLTPDRVPIQSRCRIGKIRRALGYHPRREFAATLRALLDLASDVPEVSRAGGLAESDRATGARRGPRPT